MKKKVLVIVAIVVVVLFAGVPVFAADTVINGCYKKENGQLRILTGTDSCVPPEIPISWIQGTTTPPPPDPLADAPVCFRVNGDPKFVAKLVFKKMAENNYIFTGSLWYEATLWTLMTGNALIVPSENKIYLASHEAGNGESSARFWSSQNLIVLDSTLTFIYHQETVLSWKSPDPLPTVNYSADKITSLTKITCPSTIP